MEETTVSDDEAVKKQSRFPKQTIYKLSPTLEPLARCFNIANTIPETPPIIEIPAKPPSPEPEIQEPEKRHKIILNIFPADPDDLVKMPKVFETTLECDEDEEIEAQTCDASLEASFLGDGWEFVPSGGSRVVLYEMKGEPRQFLRHYTCPVCEAKFPLHMLLRVHLRLHDEMKKFACTECGRRFLHPYALNRHIYVFHRGVGNLMPQKVRFYKGRRVDMAMLKWRRLEAPKRRWDPDRDKVKKLFTTTEISHPKRNKLQATCKVCGKTAGQTAIYNHCKREHLNIKMPYSCPECDRDFAYLSSLKTHILVHSDEKTMSCRFCHVKFKLKGDLTRHEVKKHLGGDFEASGARKRVRR